MTSTRAVYKSTPHRFSFLLHMERCYDLLAIRGGCRYQRAEPASFTAHSRGSRRLHRPRPVNPDGNTASLLHACPQRRGFAIRNLQCQSCSTYASTVGNSGVQKSPFFGFRISNFNDALVLKSAAVLWLNSCVLGPLDEIL
jgi:hypothetical protein